MSLREAGVVVLLLAERVHKIQRIGRLRAMLVQCAQLSVNQTVS